MRNNRGFTHELFPDPVGGYELDPQDGWFSVVMPEQGINLVANPSCEYKTTGYTAENSVISLDDSDQRFGVRSLKVVTTAATANCGASYDQAVSANTLYAVSWYVKNPSRRKMTLTITGDASGQIRQVSFTPTGHWQRVSVMIQTGAADASIEIKLLQVLSGAATNIIWMDALQVEQNSYPTTYIDGDQIGFVPSQIAYWWNGVPHESTSTRSAFTAAGGKEVKLLELGFRLLAILGLGMGPLNHVAALLSSGGAVYQQSIPLVRPFSLGGAIQGDTFGDLQRTRKALIQSFSPWRVSPQQELLLKYHRSGDCEILDETETLDIRCQFVEGLPGVVDNYNQERLALQFNQYLPLVMKEGDRGVELGYQEYFTTNYLAQRKNGAWSNVAAFNGRVYAMFFANGLLYTGGAYTSPESHFAVFDGSGLDDLGLGVVNGDVFGIAVAPNGDIYIVGDFTTIQGGAVTVNRIAKYTKATATWGAINVAGTVGADNDIRAVVFDTFRGLVIFGGVFANAGGVASAGLAIYDPYTDTISAFPAGPTITGIAELDIDGAGDIWAVGAYSDGGVYGVNRYSPSAAAWSKPGDGIADYQAAALDVDPAGNVYVVASMVTAPSNVAQLAHWNGAEWVTDVSWAITVAPEFLSVFFSAYDNIFYVGGGQNYAAGPYNEAFFLWNGQVQMPLDIRFPAGTKDSGPVTQNPYNGDLFISFTPSGTAYSANVTAPSVGEAGAYPTLIIQGPGTIYKIKNYTTQQQVSFTPLTLSVGQTARFNFDPLNFGFFDNLGNSLLSSVLEGSDLNFSLAAGDNTVGVLFTDNYVEFGDASVLLSGYQNITGISRNNTNNGTIYVNVALAGGGNYKITLYKDAAMSQAIAETANYATTGEKALSELNSSGIGGTITVDDVGGGVNFYVQFGLIDLQWRDRYLGIDGAAR